MYESVEVLCILERMDELFVIWMLFVFVICLAFIHSFLQWWIQAIAHRLGLFQFHDLHVVGKLSNVWSRKSLESKLKPMCGNGVEEKHRNCYDSKNVHTFNKL